MKKVLVLALAILSMSLTQAQENYNKVSVFGGIGAHSVGDESADVRDQFNHFEGGLRYNFNPTFGIAATYAKDNLSLENANTPYINTEYNRYDLEAYVDVFDVVDMQNNFITFLAHGGGGVSTIEAHETNYNQTVMNMRGGVSALFKLTRSVALYIDASTTVNLSQDRTLDGARDITNAGINSTVDNLTAGLIVSLGKKGTKLQGADWVKPVAPVAVSDTVRIVQMLPIQNNYITQYVSNLNENVYFENDLPKVGDVGEDAVGIQGRNSIKKIAEVLKANKDLKVIITGSASDTDSTTAQYDLELSKRRVDIVMTKLIALNVDPSQIDYKYIGKDKDKTHIKEFARVVTLELKSKK